MSERNQGNSLINIGINLGTVLAAIALLAIVGLILFRMLFVTFIDNYEFAFVYDKVHGKIMPIERTGYVVYTPILHSVHTIDLRPYQVSITPMDISGRDSSGGGTGGSDVGKRILNAKLVRFNPQGLDKFLEWHGRSAGDNTSGLLIILKAYAFDQDGGKDCPFLTIDKELSPSKMGQQAIQQPVSQK